MAKTYSDLIAEIKQSVKTVQLAEVKRRLEQKEPMVLVDVREKEEFRAGDVLVGEFLGDLERVLLRCEHDSHDFGSVMIVAELDPRQDWFKPSRSILDFLEQFVAAEGEKFWEPKTKECTKCRRGMPVTATTCPHCGARQALVP